MARTAKDVTDAEVSILPGFGLNGVLHDSAGTPALRDYDRDFNVRRKFGQRSELLTVEIDNIRMAGNQDFHRNGGMK